jgi:hypothetical protein
MSYQPFPEVVQYNTFGESLNTTDRNSDKFEDILTELRILNKYMEILLEIRIEDINLER